MLSVFYAVLPDGKIEKTGNIIRDEEINLATSEKVKKQKFFTWKLLQSALKELGFNADEIEFFKSENGKWSSNKFHFSMSHSHNLIAVAISDCPVGIDLEMIKPIDERLALKILNYEELSKFSTLCEKEKSKYLILKWTEKESIFKSLNQSVCRYKELSKNNKTLTSQSVAVYNSNYFLTVCHDEKYIPKFVFVSL